MALTRQYNLDMSLDIGVGLKKVLADVRYKDLFYAFGLPPAEDLIGPEGNFIMRGKVFDRKNVEKEFPKI